MAESESVESETSLMELYKKFGDSTSMHGIGRIITNQSTCKRIVWAVMVLCVSGVAVFQFMTVVNDFCNYPVTTVVTSKYETNATFPGITFCNINRKRKSRFNLYLETYYAGNRETEGAPHDTLLNTLIQTITINETEDSGHQLSDMLIKCLFNRRVCSQDNFTTVNTTIYGTCYYFGTLDPLPAYAARAGPQNGLILELNIEQYEYLHITSKVGVKVFIHSHNDPPFPEDGGILAQPGAATSIGVKKVLTRGLPSPYSTCAGANGEGSSQRNLFTNKKYTQKDCSKSCYQMNLYEECNCCDADLPCDFHAIVNMSGITPTAKRLLCNTSKTLSCQVDVEDRFLKGELGCDERCPPACDQLTYDAVVSTALWPSDSYIDTLLQNANARVFYNTTSSRSSERFARSNFLRLEIFLDSLEFLEFVAQPKYDWSMLLGNVGGLLGLWLGFSLLTAMEIAEVLMDTVLTCIRRRYTKTETVQTEQN